MAWTYNGPTTDAGTVRYLIGDVVAGSTSVAYPTLSDAEVSYEVTAGATVNAAAANAARALAARYAVEPEDKKVGDLSVSYGDRAASLLALAKTLDADANLGAIPRAGGISIADKRAVEDDTDRVVPSFTRGMHDHPGVGWPDTDSDPETRGYG